MNYKKLIAISLIFAACFFVSCIFGRYDITFGDIWNIVTGEEADASKVNIFLNVRIARTCTVAVSGGALALAGYVYQSIFRNPLVSPDTLGVSGGASVGAIIAILFFEGRFTQIFSFVGATLIVLFVFLLAKVIGGNRYFNMIISGIIFQALANSAIMAFKYMADPESELAVIDYWIMGSYSLASWTKLKSVLLPICVSVVILWLMNYKMKVLRLGDEEAQSLGISVIPVRLICIAASTVMVGSAVSISGIVSWIGLIVPHMVRIIFGEDFRENFWQSFICGGALLIAADTMARCISSSEIPISVLTSLIGAVCLMAFLIYRSYSARKKLKI